jgi:hypothetical protein
MCTSGETPVTGTQVDAAPPKSSRRRLSESGESGEGGGGLDGRWKVSRQKQKKDRGKGGTYIVFSSTVLGRQSVLKRGRGRKRKRWRGGTGKRRGGRGRERQKRDGGLFHSRSRVPLCLGAHLQLPGWASGGWSWCGGWHTPVVPVSASPVPQLLRLSD